MEQKLTPEGGTILPREQVADASHAVQQLPKILHAMSNMARRSRNQLQRKGIFLGGLWWEKEPSQRQRGILKNRNNKKLSLAKVSTYNEFWKTFTFSFGHGDYQNDPYKDHVCSPALIKRQSCEVIPVSLTRSSHESLGRRHSLCRQGSSVSFLRQSQSTAFLEPDSDNLGCTESLERILIAHLNHSFLSPKEGEILSQLEYIKMLFQIPIHKLLRQRPKEFVLPLPRRSTRSLSRSSSRSLALYQSVQNLQPYRDKSSGRRLWNQEYHSEVDTFAKRFFRPGSRISTQQNVRRFSSLTTVPKGVAFLTYPDSTDETSFEGTIGSRSIISWEKGTKFPQMGVDQSEDFRSKKEMGRQQMVQSRMRSARRTYTYNQTIYYDMCNGSRIDEEGFTRHPFPYAPVRMACTAGPRCRICKPLLQSCINRAKVRKTFRDIRRSLRATRSRISNMRFHSIWFNPPTPEIVGCRNTAEVEKARRRIRLAQKTERRKRLKMYFMAALRVLSCGIVPYVMTGEWTIFKRRRQLRTVDSRDRCDMSENPSSSQQSPVFRNRQCQNEWEWNS